jgi:hypothetical protein
MGIPHFSRNVLPNVTVQSPIPRGAGGPDRDVLIRHVTTVIEEAKHEFLFDRSHHFVREKMYFRTFIKTLNDGTVHHCLIDHATNNPSRLVGFLQNNAGVHPSNLPFDWQPTHVVLYDRQERDARLKYRVNDPSSSVHLEVIDLFDLKTKQKNRGGGRDFIYCGVVNEVEYEFSEVDIVYEGTNPYTLGWL